MPEVRSHGGGCCGIRHVAGFGGTTERNTSELDSVMWRVPGGRLAEVVLTREQVRSLPKTMKKLADQGFVLVGAFRNANSGNDCFVFHWANSRIPLTEIERFWSGQVLTPTMSGPLPARPQQVALQPNPPGVLIREFPTVALNDPFVVRSPRHAYNGVRGTVRSVTRKYHYSGNTSPIIRFMAAGQIREVAASMCEWLPTESKAPPPPPKPQPEPEPEPQPSRHPVQ